jgi:hypothetical protein
MPESADSAFGNNYRSAVRNARAKTKEGTAPGRFYSATRFSADRSRERDFRKSASAMTSGGEPGCSPVAHSICRARRSASVVGRKPNRRHVAAMSVLAEGTYLNPRSSNRMASPFRGGARRTVETWSCLQQATCQRVGDERWGRLGGQIRRSDRRIFDRRPREGRSGRRRRRSPVGARIRGHWRDGRLDVEMHRAADTPVPLGRHSQYGRAR